MFVFVLQEKYGILLLAFKTDKLTLDRRIELHKRARDVAENNASQELQGVRVAMKVQTGRADLMDRGER